MKNTISTALVSSLVLCSSVFAECPAHSDSARCSSGQCSSKDYLGASEAEIALLGKQTFHANIALVEKALKERGVSLPENGFITSDFRNALIAFQESVGLPANGEINHATLDKLGVKF